MSCLGEVEAHLQCTVTCVSMAASSSLKKKWWLHAGAASRSFTSTAVKVVTRNERQKVRVERNPSKKGYMRLHTNLGDLNLELHCDLAPRTCENFFILSEGGYYTDTIFHRSIKNFMIQVQNVNDMHALATLSCFAVSMLLT